MLFVLAGAAIYLGAALWGGRESLTGAFALLGLPALLGASAVASVSYLIRFVRWHLALRTLGSPVPAGPNLRIYLSGLALTASPGKAGETIRSVLLLPFGVPVARSLGAFFADRLSDVLGVCLLGALAVGAGRMSFNYAAVAFAAIFAGSFLLRFALLHPLLLARCIALAARWGRRPGSLLLDAMVQWARLWSLHRAIGFTALAVCAYGLQALVFAWICDRVGVLMTAARAVEIFVNATLLGAASMVPGGLGAMEAALMLQLVDQGASRGVAVAAAIAVRLVTLWCGVLIGLGCMARSASASALALALASAERAGEA